MARSILEGDPILDALLRRRRQAQSPDFPMSSRDPTNPVDTSSAFPSPPTIYQPPPRSPFRSAPVYDDFGEEPDLQDIPDEPFEEDEEYDPPAMPPPGTPPPLQPEPPPPDLPQGPIGGRDPEADVVKTPRFGAVEQALMNASPVRLAPLGLARRRSRSRGAGYPRQRTFRMR